MLLFVVGQIICTGLSKKKYRISQFSTMLDGDALFLNCTSSVVLFFGSGDNYFRLDFYFYFYFYFRYLALFFKYFS